MIPLIGIKSFFVGQKTNYVGLSRAIRPAIFVPNQNISSQFFAQIFENKNQKLWKFSTTKLFTNQKHVTKWPKIQCKHSDYQ